MQRRDARGFGHWIRLNVLDVWQVVGTLGLIVGTLTFALLIANGRHVMPTTGSAIQLLQTLVSNSPHVPPTVEPTPNTTLSPGATERAPATSAPRVPVGPVASQPPAPTQSGAPTPKPLPTPTPTPRPCLYALCPSPSPLP